MIDFEDPFGNASVITVLPVAWNNRVALSVNSRRDYVASYDLGTAKKIALAFQEAIEVIESRLTLKKEV